MERLLLYKHFYKKRNIYYVFKLNYKMLEKPPLYNYARFCTTISISYSLIGETPLQNKLINFILAQGIL